MPKIAIVTDTDTSLPPSLATQHNITQVPISVHFGDQTFLTGVDIDDAGVFARVDREKRLPTTSAPSPGQFVEAFQQAFDNGAEQIVCLTVSSVVSAIYSSATNASAEFPGKTIQVIDTRSLSLGQGFMVLEAAEAAAQGATIPEIVAHVESMKQRTHLFAALSTLKYLAMSGRVGSLVAGMATLLDVKPILTIRDGKLDLLERTRTRGKSLDRVVELAIQAAGGAPIQRMGIVHCNALDEVQAFEDRLRSRLECPTELLVAELTAGLSVHAGSGMLGVSFVTG